MWRWYFFHLVLPQKKLRWTSSPQTANFKCMKTLGTPCIAPNSCLYNLTRNFAAKKLLMCDLKSNWLDSIWNVANTTSLESLSYTKILGCWPWRLRIRRFEFGLFTIIPLQSCFRFIYSCHSCFISKAFCCIVQSVFLGIVSFVCSNIFNYPSTRLSFRYHLDKCISWFQNCNCNMILW